MRVRVRTPDQARTAVLRGWRPVTGDLTAPWSPGAAVDGADLVVHAAAYLGKDRDLAEAVNVEGTRQLARAALAAGARRFVHMSTMLVRGDPQPDGLEEDRPLATAAEHPDVATKAAAEAALNTVRSQGLPAVILRPGAICSVVNSQLGDELVARQRQSGWPAAYLPGDVIPRVHTHDLAEMTWLAATHPGGGGRDLPWGRPMRPIRDYFVPIMTALGQAFTAPDRDPVVSRCRIGKIRAVLGYLRRRAFGQTIAWLAALARSLPAPERR